MPAAPHLLTPIAHIHTGFAEKFGLPRQSGLAPSLRGKIVFTPPFRKAEAVRELEGFSHVWLIWQFSAHVQQGYHFTVRPPRLGGNRRVGVFASRSPFRPNHLGLSCVQLTGIDTDAPDGPLLWVSGVDMLDGTPIFDIKPYLPYVDSHPEALPGYTAQTQQHRLQVQFPPALQALLPTTLQAAVMEILANDPRPGYDSTPGKPFGVAYHGYDIGFSVTDNQLVVTRVTKL